MNNRQAAESIIKKLTQTGYQAYLVGGCVRDMLLGKHDIDEHDVATSARPDDIRKLFQPTRAVGARFGVMLVKRGKHWIEVASFRTDQSYTDGRRPDSVKFATIEEDAARRDFTINGLYYNPFTEEIIDLVNGKADLNQHLVRAIGNPSRRFAEDYLRMLRAVRFAAKLNFNLEKQTFHAIHAYSHHISEISAERICEELKKMLTHHTRAKGIRTTRQTGLLKYILPEIDDLTGQNRTSISTKYTPSADAFSQTLDVLSNLKNHTGFETAFAALCHLTAQPDISAAPPVRKKLKKEHITPAAQIADRICRRLTFSNRSRSKVTRLITFLPVICKGDDLKTSELKRLIGYGDFDELITLLTARCRANLEPPEILQTLREKSHKIDPASQPEHPLIDGNALAAELNLKPGPQFKNILETVYDAQLQGEIKSRQDALNLAEKLSRQNRTY